MERLGRPGSEPVPATAVGASGACGADAHLHLIVQDGCDDLEERRDTEDAEHVRVPNQQPQALEQTRLHALGC
eukprot:scaffold16721_cov87-Isochrysis_galbana.AAC.2